MATSAYRSTRARRALPNGNAASRFFKTSCITLKAATRETMDRYQQKIKKLAIAYGQDCWVLLYQADTRMRLEQFERIMRRGQLLYQASQAPNGPPTYFDVRWPWEWVFEQATEHETTFWTDEFERPALLVKTHVDKVQHHLGPEGDSVAAGSGGGASSAPRRPREPAPATERLTDRSRSRTIADRVHNVQGDKYVTNRSGVKL